jgi:dipeptidyl aminopeptidase/acylaminoacyl peptidase
MSMRTPLLPTAVAALALLALAPAGADATWRGATGDIVYDAFDSHDDLSAFRIGHTGIHNRLIVRKAEEPSWSPTGRRVVFFRGHTVWYARADGTHAKRVVRAPGDSTLSDPAWSPDGKYVSFTATFEEQGSDTLTETDYVYRVRTGGRHLRRLHKGHDAVWSRRGHRIIFVTGRRIESMRNVGGKARVLAHTSDYVGDVDLSPDASRLVYQVGAGPGAIHVLNLNTRRDRRLAPKRVGWPLDVVWAPGGKRIAYLHQDIPPDGVPFPPTQVRTIKPNATGRRTLFRLPDGLYPFSFSWQTHPRG